MLTGSNSFISLSEEGKPTGEVLYVSLEPLTQLDFLPALFKEDTVDRLLAGSGLSQGHVCTTMRLLSARQDGCHWCTASWHLQHCVLVADSAQ